MKNVRRNLTKGHWGAIGAYLLVFFCLLIGLSISFGPAGPNGQGAANANMHGSGAIGPVQGGLNSIAIVPSIGSMVSGQTGGSGAINSSLGGMKALFGTVFTDGPGTVKQDILLSQAGSNVVIKIDSPLLKDSAGGKASNQEGRIVMAAGDIFSQAIVADLDSAAGSVQGNTHRWQQDPGRNRWRHSPGRFRWRWRWRHSPEPNPDLVPDGPEILNEAAPLGENRTAEAEEEEFGHGGCPALTEWLSDELGNKENIQIYISNSFAHSTDIQPCEAAARLKDAAEVLSDPDGVRFASLEQVVGEFITTSSPISEEELASIVTILSERAGDGSYYAAAGEWIANLREYVTVLIADMGYLADESIEITMAKYGEPVIWSGDEGLGEFIEIQLAVLTIE